jgi:lipid II:glycine glycyltransferase (peptidoglycan interpeptide bridge formation enzyme)
VVETCPGFWNLLLLPVVTNIRTNHNGGKNRGRKKEEKKKEKKKKKETFNIARGVRVGSLSKNVLVQSIIISAELMYLPYASTCSASLYGGMNKEYKG